jgi:catechol 2,3-dioxygenase-like lactoylglutathione lyase family enzyme
MKPRLLRVASAALVFMAAAILVTPGSDLAAAAQDDQGAHAVLINTCLITNDVKGLAAFYARVLQIEPQWSGDIYVEFHTGAGVLALFSSEAQEKYIPGAARPAQNHSAILEFKVANVDREYTRLGNSVRWVKGPTTQPWGTRSIYFRDPDGNLIDFFSAAAKR